MIIAVLTTLGFYNQKAERYEYAKELASQRMYGEAAEIMDMIQPYKDSEDLIRKYADAGFKMLAEELAPADSYYGEDITLAQYALFTNDYSFDDHINLSDVILNYEGSREKISNIIENFIERDEWYAAYRLSSACYDYYKDENYKNIAHFCSAMNFAYLGDASYALELFDSLPQDFGYDFTKAKEFCTKYSVIQGAYFIEGYPDGYPEYMYQITKDFKLVFSPCFREKPYIWVTPWTKESSGDLKSKEGFKIEIEDPNYVFSANGESLEIKSTGDGLNSLKYFDVTTKDNPNSSLRFIKKK